MTRGAGARTARRGGWTRTRGLAVALAFGIGLGATPPLAADETGSRGSIAVPSALDKAQSAFDRHAKSWMADLEKNEAENRRNAPVYGIAQESVIRFDGYGDQYETQVKPTGHAGAPFVGILRYKENLYTCMADDPGRCTVTQSVPVSEIFSFKNGRWAY